MTWPHTTHTHARAFSLSRLAGGQRPHGLYIFVVSGGT
jgi:hypothetical protein